METLAHGIAGSAGGMLAMALLYPLDQIKTIMQVNTSETEEDAEQQIGKADSTKLRAPTRHFWAQVAEILKTKKWQVYQGHVSTQIALGGSNFVYFFCYNGLKTHLLKRQNRQISGNITPVQNLLLSCLAGVINVYICAPLWVANMRLKSKDAAEYSGVLDCLRKVTANEGFLSLWNGTLASLVLVSNPVIHYVSYERMKIALQKKRHDTGLAEAALSALDIFLLGALAKSFTTVVTYPLQVAQSLMRTQQKTGKSLEEKPTRATGLAGCLAQIYADRGVAGYFAGLQAKLLQTVLTAAISLVTYEKLLALILLMMRQQVKPVNAQKVAA
ncbi:Mitochondrial Carrier (MC) Family [Phytophthora infestans T30-4]|uniref:Mitochondrial Carrier (MC) Family n=2 Tax=Phytophthora infestans TaxID=4787 RepID=D0MSH8_PHYIT|nr:Mitochondrial Carrier (MC) Family [Phytophthora infestans T30-4]EEY58447.1 Mitochondrial Carrier (MC) Family [Phytophthora infestans T30-4]KAF4029501.1 Mitochondrial carrier protein [Phytophthora infestans]KAF4044337.1 Mitochondrial carrier protein [Phytophthora infestans]KAF4147663.1 Mitochondrial carrier protein [Phytophthora infestans]|eukprot:XP_002909633.1 Mitochondrial Carrier (MC) Family [Phytophthora infestans T30-4]